MFLTYHTVLLHSFIQSSILVIQFIISHTIYYYSYNLLLFIHFYQVLCLFDVALIPTFLATEWYSVLEYSPVPHCRGILQKDFLGSIMDF